MSEARSLEGKLCVVTGASRGAGKGVALELGAAGATVVVTGRSTRESPAEAYAELLERSGMSVLEELTEGKR